MDIAPFGKKFGDIVQQPGVVTSGNSATAKFVGANPNNNLRHGEGYLTITDEDGAVVANDSSESTLITFANSWGSTTVTVSWNTAEMKPGKYALSFRGDSKSIGGQLTPYEAKTTITVV